MLMQVSQDTSSHTTSIFAIASVPTARHNTNRQPSLIYDYAELFSLHA